MKKKNLLIENLENLKWKFWKKKWKKKTKKKQKIMLENVKIWRPSLIKSRSSTFKNFYKSL
jgi:hypothetical protein